MRIYMSRSPVTGYTDRDSLSDTSSTISQTGRDPKNSRQIPGGIRRRLFGPDRFQDLKNPQLIPLPQNRN
jgi:hypothetical protein